MRAGGHSIALAAVCTVAVRLPYDARCQRAGDRFHGGRCRDRVPAHQLNGSKHLQRRRSTYRSICCSKWRTASLRFADALRPRYLEGWHHPAALHVLLRSKCGPSSARSTQALLGVRACAHQYATLLRSGDLLQGLSRGYKRGRAWATRRPDGLAPNAGGISCSDCQPPHIFLVRIPTDAQQSPKCPSPSYSHEF